ncbi:polysaccharide deacetylase family protein [Candidatus Saccharibacteria bacterium]|nr:polysaccharide deacetylase family protein [Candidatus Saccharibacteria bacterium]
MVKGQIVDSAKVLLSFDVEEFDLPREHGAEISLKEGVKVSTEGLEKALSVLDETGVRATFFCTANFASVNPSLIRKVAKQGYEVACHGVDHFKPLDTDIAISKEVIEGVIRKKVTGYRQPRMQTIDYQAMKKLGYVYDSSVNPTMIPGRYNNLGVSRTAYDAGGIIEVPTSVATPIRIPLFWLAMHLFPKWFYNALVKSCLKKTGCYATYLHPWEFADLAGLNCVPRYIRHNSGEKLVGRFRELIETLQGMGCVFQTYSEYVDDFLSEHK